MIVDATGALALGNQGSTRRLGAFELLSIANGATSRDP